MPRFFYDTYQRQRLADYQLQQILPLTDSIHHHWCRVLRAKLADRAVLFDGFGGEYSVELVDITKKSSSVRLLSYISDNRTPALISQIGLVMSRGDRMDYAIQKATELGVSSIQLLTSHHGEVRLKPTQIDKKLTHWQQVAVSACEQCGMNRVPVILSPLPVEQWLMQSSASTISKQSTPCDFMQPLLTDKFYQFLSKPADISLVLSVPKNGILPTRLQLKTLLQGASPYVRLLIGAEGGLSDAELQQAQQANFQPWQIGNRVLRTETAPVVALATLNDWMDGLDTG